MGMIPPRLLRPRRDTSVDTNLIYDIHKAYPLNKAPNEGLDIIVHPSLDNLLENFMLALGTLLLTIGKTRASKVCAYITGGIFFQVATAPLFGIDVLSVREFIPLALTCIIGLVFGLTITHKRKPDIAQMAREMGLHKPITGKSILEQGKFSMQEMADAMYTLARAREITGISEMLYDWCA